MSNEQSLASRTAALLVLLLSLPVTFYLVSLWLHQVWAWFVLPYGYPDVPQAVFFAGVMYYIYIMLKHSKNYKTENLWDTILESWVSIGMLWFLAWTGHLMIAVPPLVEH